MNISIASVVAHSLEKTLNTNSADATVRTPNTPWLISSTHLKCMGVWKQDTLQQKRRKCWNIGSGTAVMHWKFEHFSRYSNRMSRNNMRYSHELFELHNCSFFRKKTKQFYFNLFFAINVRCLSLRKKCFKLFSRGSACTAAKQKTQWFGWDTRTHFT